MRAGGLAVGAGDAAHPHAARSIAVDLRGNVPELLAKATHGRVGHRPIRIPAKPVGLPQHGGRSPLDGLGDETPGIGAFAGEGSEQVTLADAAAVATHAIDPDHAQRFEDSARIEVLRAHTSSFASAGPTTGIDGVMGASGATRSMRSASAMTALNTGAATMPP